MVCSLWSEAESESRHRIRFKTVASYAASTHKQTVAAQRFFRKSCNVGRRELVSQSPQTDFLPRFVACEMDGGKIASVIL
jgi:hypothetical protein